MKKNYKFLSLALLLLSWLSRSASAQTPYSFSTLAPYIQNFDGMGSTAGSYNSPINSTTVPGFILGYTLSGQTAFSQITAATADDGSSSAAAVYNYGATGASDRALGGIALNYAGRGYFATRLVNNMSSPIQNFDVRYTFEQWYNSTIATGAKFNVYYRVYPSGGTAFANNDLAQIVDTTNYATWTRLPKLDMAAPGIGSAMGKCDGNSATYRRLKQFRMSNVNLAPGAEIVFCFEYLFNNNGNGMALDDISIYPETNILYSGTAGNLDDTTNWFKDTEGTIPATNVSFGADNYVYFVQGTATTSRVSTAGWPVGGSNTRIVVGTSTGSPATLRLAKGSIMGTSANPVTVDVTGGSTLDIADELSSSTTSRPYLNMGSLAVGSTVSYSAANAQNVLPGTYYNLNLAGSNSKILAGEVIVGSTLGLAQPVKLGSFNLIMQRGATIARTSGKQILADGTGELRATVIGAGSNSVPVLFPVSTTADKANYYPVSITAGSNDRDETYRVRIIDNVYPGYNASGTPSGTPSTNTNNVSKTWLISHETTNAINATVELGWSAAQGSTFVPASAYVAHYDVSGGTGWDKAATNSVGSFSDNGQAAVQRTGVSNFSPFTVTSNSAGPLPVTLVAFAAQRTASAVVCTWATASELNSSYFGVERSLDGVSFAQLGQQAAQGSSATAHTYTYLDEHPCRTLAYYRLHQVDADGTASYSPVVTVAGAEASQPAVVLPNPGTGEFVVHTTLEAAASLQATVTNALGQQVLHIGQPLPAGAASLPLDLRAQPAGLYLVRLAGPGGTQTLRLLKQ